MKWEIPPIIKLYEALGCLADGRLKEYGDEIKVYSSSGNKFYNVKYDERTNSIVANDNGSFYVGYLGYPAIAYLMKIGKLSFEEKYAQVLKGIAWKDINVKNKNDFNKTIAKIDKIIEKKGVVLDDFYAYLEIVLDEIKNEEFNVLLPKEQPPKGY